LCPPPFFWILFPPTKTGTCFALNQHHPTPGHHQTQKSTPPHFFFAGIVVCPLWVWGEKNHTPPNNPSSLCDLTSQPTKPQQVVYSFFSIVSRGGTTSPNFSFCFLRVPPVAGPPGLGGRLFHHGHTVKNFFPPPPHNTHHSPTPNHNTFTGVPTTTRGLPVPKITFFFFLVSFLLPPRPFSGNGDSVTFFLTPAIFFCVFLSRGWLVLGFFLFLMAFVFLFPSLPHRILVGIILLILFFFRVTPPNVVGCLFPFKQG